MQALMQEWSLTLDKIFDHAARLRSFELAAGL